MGNYRYVTCRTVANKAGELNGKIKAFVKTGSENLEGEYKCPECENEGKINQVFKRPISVRCEKCNFLMRMPKLKGKKK